MYWPGHVGLALLAYAPVVVLLRRRCRERWVVVGLAILLPLSVGPDIDLVVPALAHRGVTHTILGVLASGLVAGACLALARLATAWLTDNQSEQRSSAIHGGFRASWRFVASRVLPRSRAIPRTDGGTSAAATGRSAAGETVPSLRFGALIGVLAATSHLFGDVITPMGVAPVYPLRARAYTLDLVLAADPAANLALFLAGTVAASAATAPLLHEMTLKAFRSRPRPTEPFRSEENLPARTRERQTHAGRDPYEGPETAE